MSFYQDGRSDFGGHNRGNMVQGMSTGYSSDYNYQPPDERKNQSFGGGAGMDNPPLRGVKRSFQEENTSTSYTERWPTNFEAQKVDNSFRGERDTNFGAREDRGYQGDFNAGNLGGRSDYNSTQGRHGFNETPNVPVKNTSHAFPKEHQQDFTGNFGLKNRASNSFPGDGVCIQDSFRGGSSGGSSFRDTSGQGNTNNSFREREPQFGAGFNQKEVNPSFRGESKNVGGGRFMGEEINHSFEGRPQNYNGKDMTRSNTSFGEEPRNIGDHYTGVQNKFRDESNVNFGAKKEADFFKSAPLNYRENQGDFREGTGRYEGNNREDSFSRNSRPVETDSSFRAFEQPREVKNFGGGSGHFDGTNVIDSRPDSFKGNFGKFKDGTGNLKPNDGNNSFRGGKFDEAPRGESSFRRGSGGGREDTFRGRHEARNFKGELEPRNFEGGSTPRNFEGGSGHRNFEGSTGPRHFEGATAPRNFEVGSGPRNFEVGSGARNFEGGSGSRNFEGSTAPRHFEGATAPRHFESTTAPRHFEGATAPTNFEGGSGPRNFEGGSGARNFESGSGARNFESGSGARNFEGGSGPRNFEGSTGPRHFEGATRPRNFESGSGSSSFVEPSGYGNIERGPGSVNFERGPGPANFDRGPGPANFETRSAPRNFERGSGYADLKRESGPPKFERKSAPASFKRGSGAKKFERGPGNFERGPKKFERESGNFREKSGPKRFEKGSGYGNFERGSRDSRPSHLEKRPRIADESKPKNFEKRPERGSFRGRGGAVSSGRGRGKSDRFEKRVERRSSGGPGNFGPGQRSGPRDGFDGGPVPGVNFGEGPGNFGGPVDHFGGGPGPMNFGGPMPSNFGPGPMNFGGGPGPSNFGPVPNMNFVGGPGPGPMNFVGGPGPGPMNFGGPGPINFGGGPGPAPFGPGPGPINFGGGPGPGDFVRPRLGKFRGRGGPLAGRLGPRSIAGRLGPRSGGRGPGAAKFGQGLTSPVKRLRPNKGARLDSFVKGRTNPVCPKFLNGRTVKLNMKTGLIMYEKEADDINLLDFDGSELQIIFPHRFSSYKPALQKVLDLAKVVGQPRDMCVEFHSSKVCRERASVLGKFKLDNGKLLEVNNLPAKISDPFRKVAIIPIPDTKHAVDEKKLKEVTGADHVFMITRGQNVKRVFFLTFNTTAEATKAQESQLKYNDHDIIMTNYTIFKETPAYTPPPEEEESPAKSPPKVVSAEVKKGPGGAEAKKKTLQKGSKV